MTSAVTSDRLHFANCWLLPAVTAAVVALGMSAAYFDTLEGMVSTWSSYRYFYYGHCFLVFPVSLWLIWGKRRQLARALPSPEYRVLILLLPVGLGWLLAYLAEVPVAQQAALIACLILSAWMMLGTEVAKTLAFPLGFLFFALPVSTEAIIPFLMEFTANSTVMLLRISGFDVVQNGTGFLVGGRSWIVEALCSGNLYLALIVTAGILASYLLAHSWRRRLLFMVFTLTIPLISNVVRTYLIVLTVQLDVSYLGPLKEHEIFAEIGFWLVVAGLFLLIFLSRDPPDNSGEPDTTPPDRPAGRPGSRQAVVHITAGVTALAAVLLWPGLAYTIDRMEPPHSQLPRAALQALDGVGGWQGFIDLSTTPVGKPDVPADAKFHRLYGRDRQLVFLYICQYHRLTHCMTDMRHMQYVMTQGNQGGQITRPIQRRIRLGERTLEVIQTQMDGGRGTVLTWNWYRFGGRSNTNRALAQIREVWYRLIDRRPDVVTLVLSTDQVRNRITGEQVLQSFAESILPEIEAVLDRSPE
ncbi:MAG: EpsI family protein [Gammaproteobacteria bacterium]|nr:EpsI family protein [Gammaproteobacteria bacterium]